MSVYRQAVPENNLHRSAQHFFTPLVTIMVKGYDYPSVV